MILQFSVSNFRAFRKMQTLNLAASNYDKTLPQNCITPDLPGLKGRRWVKGAAIYGPNASGKSSVLEALRAMVNLVRNSAKTTDPKEPIAGIEPFAFAPEALTEPTGFGLVFVNAGVRYEYRVAATLDRVWHESLRAFPDKWEQTWFCRNWNPETASYDWTPEKPSGYKRDPKREEYTLPNVLYLSKAVSLGDTQLEPVFGWFRERLRFLDLSAGAGFHGSFSMEQLVKRSPLAPRIIEMLRHADLGVADARVKEVEMANQIAEQVLLQLPEPARAQAATNKWVQPELLHNVPGTEPMPLPWERESVGTQRYFDLAGPWLDIMAKGFVVCIDELETSMHPLMVRELLRLMFSAEENASGAQLIFTTHNPLLLDPTLLRRDQVWFTDKDEKSEAYVYALADYAPRKGESLVRGYLAGRYGAVPFIPEGLLGSFPAIEEATKGGGDEH